MTTIWQAPTQEIDPLTEVVLEAIRSQVFPVAPVGVAIEAVPGAAWREARLADGRTVRLALTVAPGEQARFGVRACANMRVSGEVAVDDHGYRVASDVIVDLKTRAVLSCDCRMESLGRIGG
ncbi:hypothetical protein [Bosea sp. BK604]|uniref:hypothetical protein n=1 Tax=Bosea sp. BK604 TaxID=2512180 RepID=UPI00104AB000|nr:hypothetical protein [Bosea sp. BK604]TCR64169.1 hypothetical protein EV560_107257 [Bosea sp. BK604]